MPNYNPNSDDELFSTFEGVLDEPDASDEEREEEERANHVTTTSIRTLADELSEALQGPDSGESNEELMDEQDNQETREEKGEQEEEWTGSDAVCIGGEKEDDAVGNEENGEADGLQSTPPSPSPLVAATLPLDSRTVASCAGSINSLEDSARTFQAFLGKLDQYVNSASSIDALPQILSSVYQSRERKERMMKDVDLRILISQSRSQIGINSGRRGAMDLQHDDDLTETLSDISGALLELHQLTESLISTLAVINEQSSASTMLLFNSSRQLKRLRLQSIHVIGEIEELERSEKHFEQEERLEASRGKGWRGRQMRAAVDSVQDLFRTDELLI